jgi:putative FmdB family regulatory protein
MPLYEYECASCGHRFEKIQRYSDPLVSECPVCGQGPVNKLLSAPAIQFKGTGWYVTDYAGKKQTPDTPSTPTTDTKTDAANPAPAASPAPSAATAGSAPAPGSTGSSSSSGDKK